MGGYVLHNHPTVPRGQMRGRGVTQMTTTLNNSYLVIVSTQGEGVKIAQNSVVVVCTRTHPQVNRNQLQFRFECYTFYLLIFNNTSKLIIIKYHKKFVIGGNFEPVLDPITPMSCDQNVIFLLKYFVIIIQRSQQKKKIINISGTYIDNHFI